jgi:glycosyltransferase involved in cell wall biosynthesis
MTKLFNPKVSIVIPVYNGSNYVKEAIDSALSQTYKNTEVVVINDGSKDGGKTDEICRGYGKKIRYFLKENGGPASALNMGIDKMEGEYFSWLSHDDVYYPEKIEKQIKFLDKQVNREKLIPYANYELIDENSKFKQKVQFNHEELVEKPEYALLRGCVNGITLLIPKKAFDKHGEFDLELKCTQDYDMWRRIMKTYTFIHMNEIYTKTRIHAQQDSNKHPNVTTEGNPLWIEMMESISKERKGGLEGTEYNFYKEMKFFLTAGTPYEEAASFAAKKMKKIQREVIDTIGSQLITVIIPFYNRIPELLRAIESVEKQSYKNLEILLINDCSKEDLSDVREYIKDDKRFKILNLEKNSGPAKARNLGIEKASGEYLAFLDSDDEFLPEKIKEQYIQMLLSGYDVSHTSYIRRSRRKEENINSGALTGNVIPSIISSCPIATPTVMIKTNFLKENKFKFREDMKIGEDTCFWLEILRDTKLLGIEKPLTVVNINEKSAAYDFSKHLEGLTNILVYVLTDKEYSTYNKNISELCNGYIEVSNQLLLGEASAYTIEERLASMNKFKKMIYLFKYQGVILTIKKVVRKYVPKLVNKITHIIGGKKEG